MLRIEFEPCQVPSLVDELGVLRDAFERKLAGEVAALEAVSAEARRRRSPVAVEAEADIDARTYQLRALARIRAQIAAGAPGEAMSVFGPSRLMSELVGGATRDVVAVLGELLDAAPRDDLAALDKLLHAGEAARAWIDTWVACRRVEWFSFDPEFDPVSR